MLKLINHTRDMRPEKRLYDRKPFSKVAFVQNKQVHLMIITNN